MLQEVGHMDNSNTVTIQASNNHTTQIQYQFERVPFNFITNFPIDRERTEQVNGRTQELPDITTSDIVSDKSEGGYRDPLICWLKMKV